MVIGSGANVTEGEDGKGGCCYRPARNSIAEPLKDLSEVVGA